MCVSVCVLAALSLSACSKPESVTGGAFKLETPAGWTAKVPAVKEGGSVDFVFTRERKSVPATLTVVLVPGQRPDADLLRRLNKSVAKYDARMVTKSTVGPYTGYQWQGQAGDRAGYQFFGATPSNSATILLVSANSDGKDFDMKALAKVLSSVASATPEAQP
jgi:hypothetical protein